MYGYTCYNLLFSWLTELSVLACHFYFQDPQDHSLCKVHYYEDGYVLGPITNDNYEEFLGTVICKVGHSDVNYTSQADTTIAECCKNSFNLHSVCTCNFFNVQCVYRYACLYVHIPIYMSMPTCMSGTLCSKCSHSWCWCQSWFWNSRSILPHIQSWNQLHLAKYKSWQQGCPDQHQATSCFRPQCSCPDLPAGPICSLGWCWASPCSGQRDYWNERHHQALFTLPSMLSWIKILAYFY